jgi:hypothetical protein
MWFRYTSSYLKMLFLLLAGAAFFLGGSLSQAGGPKIAAADWHLNDVDGKLLKLIGSPKKFEIFRYPGFFSGITFCGGGRCLGPHFRRDRRCAIE